MLPWRALRRTTVPFVVAAVALQEFAPAAATAWNVVVCGAAYAAYFYALEHAGFVWAPLFVGDRPLQDPRGEQ